MENDAIGPDAGVGKRVEYGQDYMAWKSWGHDSFGKLARTKARYYDAELKRAGRPFPNGARVLEIGFGNGSFLGYARMKGWEASGTEANAGLVELARQQGFDAHHVEDLSSFPGDAFDLVVAFDVLEHIPQEVMPDFLLQVRRILKDKGCFLARFPNCDSPFGLVYQNGDPTHVTAMGSKKVHFFAAKASMKVVYVGGEAQPLAAVEGVVHLLHRMVAITLKRSLDAFVNVVFYPRGDIAFASGIMTMICVVDK